VTDRQRRIVAQTAWRLMVMAVLTLAAAWDALGLLLGGDAAYASPSYDVLKHATPWGMRAYGPILGVLLTVTVFAYGRHSAGRGYTLLRVCMSLMAGWYVLWTVGIVGAWVIHREVLSWGGVGKLALVAALCVILARTTPTERVRG
jgi:hypothetical protein